MGRYLVRWAYKSSYGGPWEAGQAVEMDDRLAEKVNDDSPGVLKLISGERRVATVQNDRMVKGGNKRAPKQKSFVMGADQPGYGKELRRGE